MHGLVRRDVGFDQVFATHGTRFNLQEFRGRSSRDCCCAWKKTKKTGWKINKSEKRHDAFWRSARGFASESSFKFIFLTQICSNSVWKSQFSFIQLGFDVYGQTDTPSSKYARTHLKLATNKWSILIKSILNKYITLPVGLPVDFLATFFLAAVWKGKRGFGREYVEKDADNEEVETAGM